MTLPALTSLATLLAVPLVGAAVLLPHPQPAQAAPATAPNVVIASGTAHDFRLIVTATKASSGEAPTATVRVRAYIRGASGWRSHGELRLGAAGGFYWNTLEGSHAVRDFTISNDEPLRGSVQLLGDAGARLVTRVPVPHGTRTPGRLADDAYNEWLDAHSRCAAALSAWRAARPGARAVAYRRYLAELQREELAAVELERQPAVAA